ncbi:hypothetical protein HYN56_01545 [Flavobacterium crocinum]|uniref:O-antigen ligase-related domain-containing protein n=1 Tax=Flavobacterium crocinum TaxID=2183896 RepID=A0A2S1YTB7_9FLAO|nr:hypothetical protein HYN56_01545 [Flavobacterium crocinum]
MEKKELSYVFLIVLHVFLGILIFLFPAIAKLYAVSIFGFGFFYIIKTKNKNNEVLISSAYIVSAEVLLRMTDGMILNEVAKYSVLFFMFLGMIYSGFSKNAFVYWLFLLLLIPGVVLSTSSLDFNTDIRKAIAFNISGPVCLGISSIYCYQRKISFEKLKDIISSFSFPLITMLVYLFLYTPSIKDVIMGTQSNFAASGGFGPNQVSTLLGLGIFIFFVQFLFNSRNRLVQIINVGFVLAFAFRGLVTFSRGGVITAVVMILVLLIVLFFRANYNVRAKIGTIIILAFVAGVGVWSYSSLQTKGMINKRYANEDALGRKKQTQLSGREVLIETELEMFMDNPILGIGVGKNKEIRKKETGIDLPTHNEITRMLAEHGSLGIVDLLILFLAPLILFLNNKQNILALSFFTFWLLTINHAAMRIAAPAFVYALSLLIVQIKIHDQTEKITD